MKKNILVGLLVTIALLTVLNCGSGGGGADAPDDAGIPDDGPNDEANYIIADHTAVDAYAEIPDEYIAKVKTMLVAAEGESHSAAYRSGMEYLMALDSRFAVSVYDSSGYPAVSSDHLRIGRSSSVGEGDFWTNEAAVSAVKSRLMTYHNDGNPVHVIFQAWCWDMTRTESNGATGSGDYDPEYGCHWFGSSEGGVDGNHHWGIDAEDTVLTGNSVCLQTYLDAIDGYNEYCKQNNLETVVIFSTGPVDGDSSTGEKGYQRFCKHELIRSYVKKGEGRILFDYADILSYSNAGERYMVSWTSPYNSTTYTYPCIHSDYGIEQTGHIANAGALRVAKAMWWLLARMSGWEG